MTDYTTHHVPQGVVDEIVQALKAVSPYGSIEIFVQNNTITQITVRNIKKTSVSMQNGNGSVQAHVSITAHAKTI